MKFTRTIIATFALLLAAGCAKEFDDTSIKDRIDALEEQMQENTNALRKLSNKLGEASEKGLTVIVAPVTGGNKLTFSDGTSVTVMDGAKGDQGVQGKPGETGIGSVVTIAESADGDSYIISIDDKRYTIAKTVVFSLKLQTTELTMSPGKSEEIAYSLIGADSDAIVFVNACSGYMAKVDMENSKVVVTAPDVLPETGFVIITARNDATAEESSQCISFLNGSLTVTADAQTVEAEGGIVTLTVTADSAYDVTVPDDCSWVEIVNTKAVSTSYVYLSVAKNKSRLSRSVVITLSSSAGTKHVMIAQKGSDKVGIPVVRISVENGANITSKETYRNISLTISEDDVVLLDAAGRAKGRGNATWVNYPKKPYKVKFDEKQSPFGFPSNKDWTLLAEYCDKSFLRTAYMHELARLVDFPYIINYRHVQLYMNDNYMGMYILADQVEKKSNRVNIEDDGFLFENDNHWSQEPLNFRTSRKGYYYTFKYPDPEDGEIAKGDENYNFISGFMADVESALYGENFKDPVNGYRKYLDVSTFVKWFLVQELTGNYDPNMYYVLPSRNSKLQIGPIWDAEWSLGLAYTADEYSGWASLPTKPDSEQGIWTERKYFGRLFEDPYFVDQVVQAWGELQTKLPELRSKIAAVADSISEDQEQNFVKWDILDKYVSVDLVCNYTWEGEVQYAAEFFEKRVDYMNRKLQQLSSK
jgi:hypothetical protein